MSHPVLVKILPVVVKSAPVIVKTAPVVIHEAASDSGWLALAGVIIGGLLSGSITWLLARLKRGSDARVAALLVTDELLQSLAGAYELKTGDPWVRLAIRPNFGRRVSWDDNRAMLAQALTPDGYMALAATYTGLEEAAVRAQQEISGVIQPPQGERLTTTFLTADRSLHYLDRLIHRPPWWKLRARRKFDGDNEANIKTLVGQDKHLAAFMAKHRPKSNERQDAEAGNDPHSPADI